MPTTLAKPDTDFGIHAYPNGGAIQSTEVIREGVRQTEEILLSTYIDRFDEEKDAALQMWAWLDERHYAQHGEWLPNPDGLTVDERMNLEYVVPLFIERYKDAYKPAEEPTGLRALLEALDKPEAEDMYSRLLYIGTFSTYGELEIQDTGDGMILECSRLHTRDGVPAGVLRNELVGLGLRLIEANANACVERGPDGTVIRATRWQRDDVRDVVETIDDFLLEVRWT